MLRSPFFFERVAFKDVPFALAVSKNDAGVPLANEQRTLVVTRVVIRHHHVVALLRYRQRRADAHAPAAPAVRTATHGGRSLRAGEREPSRRRDAEKRRLRHRGPRAAPVPRAVSHGAYPCRHQPGAEAFSVRARRADDDARNMMNRNVAVPCPFLRRYSPSTFPVCARTTPGSRSASARSLWAWSPLVLAWALLLLLVIPNSTPDRAGSLRVPISAFL